MAEQKIELRKIRDFGENISDTFSFIRQHASALFRSFLSIALVFIIAQGVFASLYETRASRVFRNIFTGRGGTSFERIGDIINLNYFLLIIASLMTVTAIQVIVSVYIKYYLENRTKPGVLEVWNLFKRYFLKVFLFQFPVGITLLIGFACCILPGIYLMVVLAPLTLVLVIEDKGLIEAYNRCLELIKDNFWPSLGLYIVAYILYGIGSGVIGGSLTVIGLLAGYLSTSELGRYVVAVTAFFKPFSYIFSLIYFICVALNYFSLVEKRDGTGMLSRIDSIGNNPGGSRETEEQF